MSVTELKQQLHTAIDEIENKAFLEAMLTILGSQWRQEDPLTEQQYRVLKEREAKYLRGESSSIPWEEVQAQMKKKYGF